MSPIQTHLDWRNSPAHNWFSVGLWVDVSCRSQSIYGQQLFGLSHAFIANITPYIMNL